MPPAVVITTTWDVNGDGGGQRDQVVVTAPDGSKATALKFTNGISWMTGVAADDVVKTVSGDGRVITVQHFSPGTNTLDQSETTVVAANANGSYSWTQKNGSGTVTASATHTIDANGIDTFVWSTTGNSGSLTMDTAMEAKELATIQRLYDTILDRDMTSAEEQLWGQYAFDGVVHLGTLGSALLTSTEFTQKYGTLSNTALIEQLYQNTLGRSASISEMMYWLNNLTVGGYTTERMARDLSESVEHEAAGNGHLAMVATSSGFEHITDNTVATNLVGNIYNVVLGARPGANVLSTWVNGLTSGSMSTAQVVAAIMALGTAASRLPSANSAFVATLYYNAFGVAPSSADLTFWSNALTAGTVSRADLVTALAEAPSNFVTDPASSGSFTGTNINYTYYYDAAGHPIAQSGYYTGGALVGDTWFATLNPNGTASSYKFNDLNGANATGYTNSVG